MCQGIYCTTAGAADRSRNFLNFLIRHDEELFPPDCSAYTNAEFSNIIKVVLKLWSIELCDNTSKVAIAPCVSALYT